MFPGEGDSTFPVVMMDSCAWSKVHDGCFSVGTAIPVWKDRHQDSLGREEAWAAAHLGV